MLARLLSCASVDALEASITPAVGGPTTISVADTASPVDSVTPTGGGGEELLKKWKLYPSALPQLKYSNLPCSDVLYVLQCDPSM